MIYTKKNLVELSTRVSSICRTTELLWQFENWRYGVH